MDGRLLTERLRSRAWEDRQHRQLRANAADEIDELVETLRDCHVALNDWIHQYAPELSDPTRVAESCARISEVGTLAYVGRLISRLNSLIAKHSKP